MSADFDPFPGMSPEQKSLAWESLHKIASQLADSIHKGETIGLSLNVVEGQIVSCLAYRSGGDLTKLTDWSFVSSDCSDPSGADP